MQFLFVWLIYCTFSCVISLIYWFLNRLFHETLVDQNFGKPKFWQNFVIWIHIQASDFCSIFGRDRTTQPSQNACNLYRFWRNILLAIISFLQNTKKLFLFLRNGPFSNTLIFADCCWCQQKLEGLWQQTLHQQTPFDRFYQLTTFHDQSINQTGSIEE